MASNNNSNNNKKNRHPYHHHRHQSGQQEHDQHQNGRHSPLHHLTTAAEHLNLSFLQTLQQQQQQNMAAHLPGCSCPGSNELHHHHPHPETTALNKAVIQGDQHIQYDADGNFLGFHQPMMHAYRNLPLSPQKLMTQQTSSGPTTSTQPNEWALLLEEARALAKRAANDAASARAAASAAATSADLAKESAQQSSANAASVEACLKEGVAATEEAARRADAGLGAIETAKREFGVEINSLHASSVLVRQAVSDMVSVRDSIRDTIRDSVRDIVMVSFGMWQQEEKKQKQQQLQQQKQQQQQQQETTAIHSSSEPIITEVEDDEEEEKEKEKEVEKELFGGSSAEGNSTATPSSVAAAAAENGLKAPKHAKSCSTETAAETSAAPTLPASPGDSSDQLMEAALIRAVNDRLPKLMEPILQAALAQLAAYAEAVKEVVTQCAIQQAEVHLREYVFSPASGTLVPSTSGRPEDMIASSSAAVAAANNNKKRSISRASNVKSATQVGSAKSAKAKSFAKKKAEKKLKKKAFL